MFGFRKTVGAALVLASAAAGAGEPPTPGDKAKSALAIARAAREREKEKASLLTKAENPAAAFEAAAKAKKPLVLWVGMDGSKDKPDVYKQLACCAVQFQVDEFAGNKTPRLVYSSADGMVMSLAPDQLGDAAVKVIKQSWMRVGTNAYEFGAHALLE